MPGYNKATIGVKAGVQAWRIEKMEVAEVEQKTIGSFYSGDCYIVLKTTDNGGRKTMDLHFWLGKDSSQDERGAVAYKAVELDDLMGGKPVQHREVQGHESALFLSYFPEIKYLDGGVDSAFNHVDPSAYQPRLLHLKGKRHVRVQQVDLSSASLNDGDVFILDCGLTLFQWNGKGANKYEKFKGLEVITHIKDKERGGKAKAVFLDSGKAGEDELFWQTLGPKDLVKSEDEGGRDDDIKAYAPRLYRISDASGHMEMSEVATGKLSRDMLDTNDVFLLDVGTEVMVWIGKGATKDERAKGMVFGQEYLQRENRPSFTPLTRLAESGETAQFKSYFHWTEPTERKAEAKREVKREPVIEALYAAQKKAEEKMVDGGEGKVEVWRIENLKPAPWPVDKYGQFYAGDSFLILYTYQRWGKESYIIYFWQGRDSSTDEKAASALWAVNFDDERGGSATQVRVVQNKEPNHFLTLFKGKMIIHEGGAASAFKNRKDQSSESEDQGDNRLYHIKGTDALNTRAVQVPLAASSLNSGDCFALVTPSTLFVWRGQYSNDVEKATAASISAVLQGARGVVTVDEASESEEFWSGLGGKGDYASVGEEAAVMREPRLFHCSCNSGTSGGGDLQLLTGRSDHRRRHDSRYLQRGVGVAGPRLVQGGEGQLAQDCSGVRDQRSRWPLARYPRLPHCPRRRASLVHRSLPGLGSQEGFGLQRPVQEEAG